MPTGIGFIDKLFTGKDGKGVVTQLIDGVGQFINKPEDKLAAQKIIEDTIKNQQDFALKVLEEENANTANARDMNAKIQGDKPSFLSKNVAYIIDIFVMIVWGAMTVYIGLRALKLLEDSHPVDFSVILGIYAAVSTQMGTVLNFHRGSSKGSEDKSKVIDKLTNPS